VTPMAIGTNSARPRRSLTTETFFDELLHHVDLHVTLGQQPPEPRIFLLQLLQPLHVRLRHRAVLALPGVIRRLVGNDQQVSPIAVPRQRH